MVNIVLVEPEIPQNCGNIARTCAATRCHLHLIEPLGFDISEKAVRRAGLDYWPMVELTVYRDLDDFFSQHPQPELWPQWLRERYRDRCIRIPMREDARSLNLSNSVAILTYEALKQQGFPGLSGKGSMAKAE